MKVRVTVTVEVDPEMWAYEYSMVDTSKKAIREDVATSVVGYVAESFACEAGLMKVVNP